MKKFLGIRFGHDGKWKVQFWTLWVSSRHVWVLGVCPQIIFLALPCSAVYQQMTCWLKFQSSRVSWLVAWFEQWEVLARDLRTKGGEKPGYCSSLRSTSGSVPGSKFVLPPSSLPTGLFHSPPITHTLCSSDSITLPCPSTLILPNAS